MKDKSLNNPPPFNIDKEVNKLNALLKTAESMLAPGEEITPEKLEMIKKGED